MITDVVVKRADGKGKGVFALRGFRKGEFIFRRRHGQVVRNEELSSLSEEDQMHICELNFYLVAEYRRDCLFVFT